VKKPLSSPVLNSPNLSRRNSIIAKGSQIEKITSKELETVISNRTTPVLIDFFATWCGPCVLLAQELQKVAEEQGDKLKIVKVDVDENPDICSTLNISGLPTLIFIPKDADKHAYRTEGLLPAHKITEVLGKL